jgi:putative tricarboxylic transport membrane protein
VILTSIGLLVNEYFTPDDHAKGITANVKGFVATFVLLFAYIFTLDILGFVISSILYMFIQMCIFVPKELGTKRNYILFVIISVVTPIIVNEVFVEVFSLILPTGLL